jgi:hypothetical protein
MKMILRSTAYNWSVESCAMIAHRPNAVVSNYVVRVRPGVFDMVDASSN